MSREKSPAMTPLDASAVNTISLKQITTEKFASPEMVFKKIKDYR